MKILHILYSGLGGHGNVFFSMADADKSGERKYEALFFGVEEMRDNYIEKARTRNIPWYYVKKNPGLDFKAYRGIREVIKKSAPDVIFIHSSSLIFYVKIRFALFSKKAKVVVRETQPNHLKTKQQWAGLAYALLFADKVVFLSTEFRDAIKKKLSFFFSDKRTTVIPNGIDLNVYKPDHKYTDGFFRIGMQSRLSDTKDHATLLKAFAICLKQNKSGQQLRLLIAGDGTCRPGLELLSKELGIEHAVEFTGMLEETDLPAFINSLNIYVHATLGETMSTAIMQVMACRLPIIASDVLGVNNMIRDKETGLLIPAQNEKELADALLFLMADKAEAERLAENAYQFALKNYGNSRMLESYIRVFSES